ncbi:hypothetical protein WJX82_004403 [Trebouxia sp. C0006]
MRCQLQQTSRTSLGSRSACQPQLSRKFAPTQPLSSTSRVVTQAGLFGLQFGGASATDVNSKKEELLAAIQPLQRGVSATEDDQKDVEQLIKKLEKSKRPAVLRPNGPIFQYIDAPNGKARNQESWPFFNSVAADLSPETNSRVGVQFTQFKIFGLLPITAPESAKGKLDTTFVDEELRISRGDKGNLFVLMMEDPSGKP